MTMKVKKASGRSIAMKVKDEVKENGASKTEKLNKSESRLSPDLLRKINAYWRAANYLSVGQIYLYDNPLLKEPLKLSHVKPLVVGHWGTTPGQNFIYVHLNRVIKKYDLDMFYIAGPGHGGPAIVGNVYLEGTWSEIYPNVSQDEAGLKKLFKQFSFPGGISSHVAPTTPGSIHEGGELGYSLSHAFGAAFDNPELIVACRRPRRTWHVWRPRSQAKHAALGHDASSLVRPGRIGPLWRGNCRIGEARTVASILTLTFSIL